jgi:hypothetical protein
MRFLIKIIKKATWNAVKCSNHKGKPTKYNDLLMVDSNYSLVEGMQPAFRSDASGNRAVMQALNKLYSNLLLLTISPLVIL